MPAKVGLGQLSYGSFPFWFFPTGRKPLMEDNHNSLGFSGNSQCHFWGILTSPILHLCISKAGSDELCHNWIFKNIHYFKTVTHEKGWYFLAGAYHASTHSIVIFVFMEFWQRGVVLQEKSFLFWFRQESAHCLCSPRTQVFQWVLEESGSGGTQQAGLCHHRFRSVRHGLRATGHQERCHRWVVG